MKFGQNQEEILRSIRNLSRYTVILGTILFGCILSLVYLILKFPPRSEAIIQSEKIHSPEKSILDPKSNFGKASELQIWKAPDSTEIPKGAMGEDIKYGHELIVHTSRYFGPNGSIAHLTNGMNCQNCHLEGGTRTFGNNFASFYSSYPKLSNRSGKMSPPSQRIVECMQRSLSGVSPDTNSKEIRAILSYLKWIGQGVKKSDKLFGTASEKLPFLTMAADPEKGKVLYLGKCQTCHGKDGEGVWSKDRNEYIYPPLWGKFSFNDGAGMYRIINMAGFIKNNMPYGANYLNPQLSNEEAWNLAAFIESQPRNHFNQSQDWKDLRKKPIDLPYGPYLDGASEKQHKYGPFKPIQEELSKL